MHFPIAGISVNPLWLVGIGFAVGVLGGFFGVGGGFLAGSMMLWLGVPTHFVVGTDLAHMTGKSIVAAKRHRTLGHVDVKLGLVMVAGTVAGVEIGARVIEWLEHIDVIDQVIGTTYIVILAGISLFVAWESLRALRLNRTKSHAIRDTLGFQGFTERVSRIHLPPMVSFPASGIDQISLWLVLGVGFITGLLAGMLGVGGGFVRMPMLVYVLGIPTHVAVGTDLFEIMISASFGTLTHALKGNVDILMALVMHTGAALGAQIGAALTSHFEGPRIRLLFSGLPLLGALLVLLKLTGGGVH
jgi:hypothetical protein